MSSRPELLPKAVPGSVSLPYPQSVLMSVALVTTEDNEDRAAGSWSRPLLATALGKIGPDPHQLQHSREGSLNLTWTAHYS